MNKLIVKEVKKFERKYGKLKFSEFEQIVQGYSVTIMLFNAKTHMLLLFHQKLRMY